ncbi:MAG: potassium channel family protein [Cytophagaceae bacterium]
MKVIIIGLGNFGASLGIKLTEAGHEVIGVDTSIQKVESLKDKITHTICMDVNDTNAISSLPLKDTDLVVVAIGEDVASSLMATATLKQFKVKKLMSRNINPMQKNIVEAIGVDEIVSPEEDSAERLAKKLELKGVVDSYAISKEYSILEIKVPERYVGKTIEQCRFREKYNVNIVTIIRKDNEDKKQGDVLGVVSPSTVLEKRDILVIFGHLKDMQRLL